MKLSTANSWWHRATVEQRLAQIDGGIECGLSAREVAIASGLLPEQGSTVSVLASKHKRRFPAENIDRRFEGHRRRGAVGRARRAFLNGEPVDLWGNSSRQDEFALDAVEA